MNPQREATLDEAAFRRAIVLEWQEMTIAERASAAYKAGVCYRIELRHTIPTDSHGFDVDAVITD